MSHILDRVATKQRIVSYVGWEFKYTCLSYYWNVLGKGKMLVVDKEGDGSNAYPFRYPVVMKMNSR